MKKKRKTIGLGAAIKNTAQTAPAKAATSLQPPSFAEKMMDDSRRAAAVQYHVDPASCRIWADHNRDYSLLDENRCESLLKSLIAEGRQRIPAIVRPVVDDPDYKYEVVAGARRHWAVSYLREHNYPDMRYFVEVRQLTDEEAFRLADLENREREDISDYERAVEYKRALKTHYNTQKEMAERLNVKDAWLSKYLRLADLPKYVVRAFPELLSIKTNYAAALLPLLKDRGIKARIEKISSEFELRRENGENYSAADVMKAYRQAVTPVTANAPVAQFAASNKSVPLTLKSLSPRRLHFNVDRTAGVGRKELVKLFEQALKEYL